MPDTIRVRYAPSPTGEPHLGNLRTALFDWLFARRHGGAFIVRIEDTDQERLVPGAVKSILESLAWLGLDWDEGPEGVEGGSRGPLGPYYQSQRLHHYHAAIQELLAKRAVYRCFCPPQRLSELRQRQQQEKRPPGYDGLCRDLAPAEAGRRLDAGEPSVVRLRMPREGVAVFDDVVRGRVEWENRLLDDMVLLKSDGFPTYHLANVVDDHLMQISHVIRGEEWVPSTPRHMVLYQALGWDQPVFVHISTILGPDRARLSKRHGAKPVLAYRDEGYLSDALVNFLALMGWSLDDKTELISREELMAHFALERLTSAPAIFDREKLTWMNGVYLRRLPTPELADRLLPFLERPASQGGLPDLVPRPLDRDYLERVVPLVQERLKTLADDPKPLLAFCFQETLAYDSKLLVQKGMDAAGTRRSLEVALARLEPTTPWDAATLEGILRPLAEELALKTGQLFGVLRVAVTGQTVSPPLFQTMEVLGRERCLARLRAAVAQLP
jgi:glutamyl-tRNA synthetase